MTKIGVYTKRIWKNHDSDRFGGTTQLLKMVKSAPVLNDIVINMHKV